MQIIPITYVFHKNSIICHTIEGTKIDAMRTNPSVCFQVDEIDDLRNWRSLLLWGNYQELKGTEAEEALQVYLNQLNPYALGQTSRPVFGLDTEARHANPQIKTVTFSISVLEASGRFEKN